MTTFFHFLVFFFNATILYYNSLTLYLIFYFLFLGVNILNYKSYDKVL